MQFSAPLLRRVHDVWRALPRDCEEGPPARRAFDPLLLAPRDLRFIVLLDVEGGPDPASLDFVYRVVGTGVVEAVGLEFTGLRLSEHLDEHDAPRLIADYRAAVESRAPRLFRGVLQRVGKDWLGYERLALPMSDPEGGRIVSILGAVAFERADRLPPGSL
ncbi:MAG: hypothetical protein RIB45_06220 [Marivibrio sp.]|uniref:hypothetical protein n=1 Tax=Marivibrio sp. TaxID=2039719 RepID=UPI0032EBF3E3